jgi:hypothetical protein
MNVIKNRIVKITVSVCLLIFLHSMAYGWYDKTHVTIAKTAGYDRWFNAVGADIAKIKAGSVEAWNHVYNNNENQEITPEQVLAQTARYNDPHDTQGHLYGAIIAALREYKKSTLARKYAEYHVAYCAHYVGDLSQPLHNMPNDAFNQRYHHINDGIVDEEVMESSGRIKENMHAIVLRPERFEEDLAREIAQLANTARYLGLRLKRENRIMTKDEAYRQLGHSASLLRAILVYLGKLN